MERRERLTQHYPELAQGDPSARKVEPTHKKCFYLNLINPNNQNKGAPEIIRKQLS